MIAVTLSLSIMACGGGDNPEDHLFDELEKPTESGGNNNGKDLGGTMVDQTQESGDFTVTVKSIVKSNGSGAFKPTAGNVFVFIKVIVKNNSREEKAVSSLLYFDAYADGEQAAFSLNAGSALYDMKGQSIDGDVAAGGTYEGYYYLEAPASTKTIELTFNTGLFDDLEKVRS